MKKTPAPREWEKYKIRNFKQEALFDEAFRKDLSTFYGTLGSDIRWDTAENFLTDLDRDKIPVRFIKPFD